MYDNQQNRSRARKVRLRSEIQVGGLKPGIYYLTVDVVTPQLPRQRRGLTLEVQ